MADETREFITARAGGRCEYCQMHQSLQGATFHIEHVVPRVKGGQSDSSNLALACPSCNLHKADRISSQPSSSITAVAFFNRDLKFGPSILSGTTTPLWAKQKSGE